MTYMILYSFIITVGINLLFDKLHLHNSNICVQNDIEFF